MIDMYCYRRWGHNEGDEPAFTQPLLYRWIENHKSVRDAYLEHLLALGEVTQAEADEIAAHRRENLDYALSLARREDFLPRPKVLGDVWKRYHGGPERLDDDVETGVAQPRLTSMLHRLTELPDDFHLHHKLKRMLESRRQMAAAAQPLDWAAAEALAYASLSLDGYRVRLSGQDSIRGTFSHRHAAFYDTEDGHSYFPLKNLSAEQMPIEIYNSPLSEAGVLGFDYGYSLGYPDALVLWEAQFGDFANAAQVIIDQFILSAEEKWRHLSGVVLLLPHGFEGQGPEHSSAGWSGSCGWAPTRTCKSSCPARRPILPRAAAAGHSPLAEAAGRAHAQEPAAASGLCFAPGGPDPRPFPARDCRSDDGRQAAQPCPVVQRQGILRASGDPQPAAPGRGDPAAWSKCIPCRIRS